MTDLLDELTLRHIAAVEKHREAREAHNLAEELDNRTWEAMNELTTELFRATYPDVAYEVDCINLDKEKWEAKVKSFRAKISDMSLKLPQYFLEL